MPSSWSPKPAGTCPRASSCRPISPSFCCRRSAQSSTRSRTSGSSCATTGSPTASSNPTTISSTIVVQHGTSSSTSLGASCPSDCANGPTGSDQWDLVLRHAFAGVPPNEQYVFLKLIADRVCMACGSQAVAAAQELENRRDEDRCLICGSPRHKTTKIMSTTSAVQRKAKKAFDQLQKYRAARDNAY